MTSMNETERNPISKVEQNTESQGFFRKGSNKAPLGVDMKVDGAVKYVVPNSNYMGMSTQDKTSQGGSPRSTIYTQMGHMNR